MPVSGLVVTLAPPPPPETPPETPNASDRLRDSSTHVIEQIHQHPHLQVGPRQGQCLPVVVDTPDRETDKRCWLWLNGLPGVHHVDVAFIHFEDEDAFDASCCDTHTDRLILAPTIGET